MNNCECCGNANGNWYLMDQNAEVTLCRKCAKDLRNIGEEIERIEE